MILRSKSRLWELASKKWNSQEMETFRKDVIRLAKDDPEFAEQQLTVLMEALMKSVLDGKG